MHNPAEHEAGAHRSLVPGLAIMRIWLEHRTRLLAALGFNL
jgi:hypothetical protein